MTDATRAHAGPPPAVAADADAVDYPPPLTGWLTVAVLFLLYILSLTDRYIIALMVEPIKASLGLSDLQMSLLQGPAFALLFCLCAIPAGIALDRFSRRGVLFVSVMVWSLAAAACGLAKNFTALFAARAVVGAGESGFGTGAYSIIGDSFPPQRVGMAMSIFVMGGVMGAGIVFLLGGPLVAAVMRAGDLHLPLLGVLEPWQQVFLITGLPGVAMAFMVFWFREPGRRARPAAASIGYGEALRFLARRRGLFASIFLGFGAAYAVTIGFQLWAPSYFMRVHGWEPARTGVALGLIQIGAACSLPLHGWVVDRLFRRGRRDAHLHWCMLTVLLAAPCAIAGFLSGSAWLACAGFAAYMTLIMSTASMGPAVVQVVTPQALRGRVSAVYVLTTGLVGMALGPTLVGWITDRLLADEMRVGDSLVLTVFIVLLPAVLLFAFGRSRMRRALEAGA
ncbi:MFS transporter [Luteimonas saliphila]|uniref:MFS transporter n=1 Tax=Luteimonas saliphila TaxID=2804919 RepID=UPI00192DCC59|nr:MFS transporter [Luteimonas saliphila]